MANQPHLPARVLELIRTPGATVSTFLKGLAAIDAEGTEPAVTLPKAVTVTAEQQLALSRLALLVSTVEWPTARRALATDEEKNLGDVLEAVKAVKGLVSEAEASLRVALFNHADVVLEKRKTIDESTPRDGKGFALVPYEGEGWKRTVTAGTPAADAEVLREMDANGEIDHADYLAATRPTRVIDEGGLLKLIARKPQLLGKLRRAIKYTRRASVSLTLD